MNYYYFEHYKIPILAWLKKMKRLENGSHDFSWVPKDPVEIFNKNKLKQMMRKEGLNENLDTKNFIYDIPSIGFFTRNPVFTLQQQCLGVLHSYFSMYVFVGYILYENWINPIKVMW